MTSKQRNPLDSAALHVKAAALISGRIERLCTCPPGASAQIVLGLLELAAEDIKQAARAEKEAKP